MRRGSQGLPYFKCDTTWGHVFRPARGGRCLARQGPRPRLRQSPRPPPRKTSSPSPPLLPRRQSPSPDRGSLLCNATTRFPRSAIRAAQVLGSFADRPFIGQRHGRQSQCNDAPTSGWERLQWQSTKPLASTGQRANKSRPWPLPKISMNRLDGRGINRSMDPCCLARGRPAKRSAKVIKSSRVPVTCRRLS